MEHFKQKTLQNFRLLRIIFKDLMAYNTEIDEKNDQWKTWKIQPNEGRIYETEYKEQLQIRAKYFGEREVWKCEDFKNKDIRCEIVSYQNAAGRQERL